MAGQLWVWGENGGGLLGDNTTTSKSSPVQTTAGGSNWSNGSFGGLNAAAIKTDGTLWTWGYGNNGYLGDNTTVSKSSPVQTVTGGNNWSIVSCGYYHTAAIKTDGTLWLWGKQGGLGGGNNGGLGDNTTTNRSSPVQTVTGGNNWSKVSVGFSYSAAIKTDGTLWLWGRNSYGQIGDNTTIHRSSPVQTIAGGNNWNFVACGNYQTAAIKTDGTLWVWGRNNAGQLGDNTTTNRSSPVQTIATGNNWTKISCSKDQTAAIKSDGTLWLWGSNGNGELGDNTVISKSSPIQTITRGTNWSQVTCGNQYTAATKTDGTLWLWGLNAGGKLGDNTTTSKSSPIQTTTFGNKWSIVGTGYYSTLAIYENTPSALSIATQPVNAYTGQKLLNQPVVSIVDSSGAIVQTPPIVVTVALASGSPTLTGNTNILSSGGVVSYSDLALSGIGSGSLIFTASGLTSAISNYVAVEQSSIAIVPKRTETSGRIPYAEQLRNGELAINIADKKGYVKNSSGAIVNVFTGLGDSVITSGMVAENAINMREIAPGAVGPSELASGVIGGSNSQILYNSSGAITGTAALTLSTTSGVVTIAPQNAGYNALTLRSFTSQTADLLKVQNSAGSDIARINASGEFFGLLASGIVTSGAIASGSVGNFHIASGAVTSGDIGNAAVVSGSIASGSVGTFHIASGSITSDLIASGAIINADVADNAVTSGKIASGTISVLHISSGGVQNVNIASGAVLSGNIASGQIGQFHFASGSVTSGTVGNAAVVSGSIASGSIGSFHIASGAVTSGYIGNNAVVSGSIASGSIGLFHFASGQVAAGGSNSQVQHNSSGALAGAAAMSYSTTSPHVTIQAQNAAYTPLIVKGTTSQTADLLQLQTSTGYTPFAFNVSGQATMTMTNSLGVPISMRLLDDTYGTVSWEGSLGQLFSISNNMTGIIFSVNDISGIPSIDVNSDGTVRLAQYAGNVGIRKATPSGLLDVGGDAIINGLTVGRGGSLVGSGIITNTVFGFTALATNNSGYLNTAIGYTSLYSNTTGAINTAIGASAMYSNTTSIKNVAVGYSAMYSNTTGSYSTAVGVDALYYNLTGNFNNAFGHQALLYTTGSNNTGVGFRASMNLTSGTGNVTVGHQAGINQSIGSYNTLLGTEAGYSNATAGNVVAVGYQALYSNTASGNVAVGYQALYSNTSAAQNTALGYQALNANTAAGNVALGYQTLLANTVGTGNVGVGRSAISANVSGSYNTAINESLQSNTLAFYNTAIGYAALNSTTVGGYNTAVGGQALALNQASGNVAVGYQAGYSNTTGTANSVFGYQAGYSQTTGNYNTAIGYQALSSGQGSNNTVVGYRAGYSLRVASNNSAFGFEAMLSSIGGASVAIGFRSLRENISGSQNVSVGTSALQNNLGSFNVGIGGEALQASATTGNNVAVGYQALYSNTASGNVAVGTNALYANSTGQGNAAVGFNSLTANVSGNFNTAVGFESFKTVANGYGNTGLGYQAGATVGAYRNSFVGYRTGYLTTSGNTNQAFGWQALYNNTLGNANTALGAEALGANTVGNSNVAIGNVAGYYQENGATALQSGNNSVYIGALCRGFSNSDSNSIVIGYQAIGQGANTTVIGNTSTVSGTIYGNINFPIGIRVNTGSSTQKGVVVQGAASQTANLTEWQNNTGTNLAYMDSAGNFYAVSKSFYIDHPTKPGKKLRHVCVEAPSADVYFRGKSNSNMIDLPDYWSGLVGFDTITVMLTPVGKKQDLYFEKIENNKVYVGGDENPAFNFVIFGERKDIPKVVIED